MLSRAVLHFQHQALRRSSAAATIQQHAHFSMEATASNEEEIEIEETGFKGEKSIQDFALSSITKQYLLKAGFDTLFPVQVKSFDTMTSGRDLMGRSKTGSGKTLAFALPIIERIRNHRISTNSGKPTPQALVLLPTRELSSQVAAEFQKIAPDLKIVNMVGGVSYDVQRNALRRGVDVLVCTPGRLMDTMDQGVLDLSQVEIAVLDEADMMLKVGFQEAVERIFNDLPPSRQTVLWSATFPKWVAQVSKQFLKTPEFIDLVGSDEHKTPDTVTHKAICIQSKHRAKVLGSLIQTYGEGGQCLIFTETKRESDELRLALDSTKSRALHGDLSQSQRQDTIKGFREGRFQTIVCTDIAARGLDIANVDLVIHYRLPNDRENFVHRSGRTGRAGRKGTNLVLFQPDEISDVKHLEKEYGLTFGQVSIPSAETLVVQASASALASLDNVKPRNSQCFETAASTYLASAGRGNEVKILSKAMALISGFGAVLPLDYSFQSGAPSTKTWQLSLAPDQNLRDIVQQLNTELDQRSNISLRDLVEVSKTEFLVDVSTSAWNTLNVPTGEGFTLGPVSALPSLHPGLNRGSSVFGHQNSSGGAYRQGAKFGRGGSGARSSRSSGSSRNAGEFRSRNQRGESRGGNHGHHDRRSSRDAYSRSSSPSRSSSTRRSSGTSAFEDRW